MATVAMEGILHLPGPIGWTPAFALAASTTQQGPASPTSSPHVRIMRLGNTLIAVRPNITHLHARPLVKPAILKPSIRTPSWEDPPILSHLMSRPSKRKFWLMGQLRLLSPFILISRPTPVESISRLHKTNLVGMRLRFSAGGSKEGLITG